MREEVLDDARLVPFAQLHSGVTATAPGQLNPYKLGLELFRDIEDRWNKGKFGPEWEGCTDAHQKENWDLKLGLGRQKIMEVRKLNNDLSFIANYLTQEFCEDHKLFTFSQNRVTGDYVIRSKEFEKVREQLIKQLVNSGRPSIHIQDANYQNRGEMLLKHNFESDSLREDYAQGVMQNLFSIWGKPIHLETQVKTRNVRFTFDEKGFSRKFL
jgi:stage V sporulation protein R